MFIQDIQPLKVELYPYQFDGLKNFCVQHYLEMCNLSSDAQALLPDYYWTINSHILLFSANKVYAWQNKNSRKKYLLKLPIDLALVIAKYMDDFSLAYMPFQELKLEIIRALVNRGFPIQQFDNKQLK